jgi:GNAT superfamily N-acetyltransferase
LPKAARCFGLYDNDKIIGFVGVLHQPHPTNKKLKRISRLVILPDYQGIGLATKFITEIAKHYKNLGYEMSINTSAKNMIHALNKNSEWILFNYGAHKNSKTGHIDKNRISIRNKCKVASFKYKGK